MEHARLGEEIQELMVRVDKAWNAADSLAFAENWTPDGTIASPRGDLSSGRARIQADIGATLDGYAKGSCHRLTVNRVHETGPDVAFVEGEAELSAATGRSRWRSAFVAVCVRQPGGLWAIAHLRSFPVGGSE